MSSSFRFILPQPPITAASTNPGDGDSNDMLPTFAKNSAPCANCSSAQQACIIHAPYSRFLCKKCSREHRNECPPHMPRIDAMLWKQLDRMSKLTGATSIQDVNLNVPTAVFIEGSANNEGTIAYSLPNLCAEATIQQGQNMEIHTSDAQGSQMPAFIENFGLHPASVSVTDGELIGGQTQNIAPPTYDETSQDQVHNILFAMNDNFAQVMFKPQAIDQYLNTVPDVLMNDFNLTSVKK